jgi:hypothetical protein
MEDKKGPKKGSKRLILDFLIAKVGRVVESRELQRASGWKAEWARRVRELRDEEGWPILSHKDRSDLKPGQYLLDNLKQRPAFHRTISKETRAYVLERNGYTCQMCGMAAGDADPLKPSRTVRLTMGHIIDKSKGGDDSVSNLRAYALIATKACRMPLRPSLIVLFSWLKFAEPRYPTKGQSWNGF